MYKGLCDYMGVGVCVERERERESRVCLDPLVMVCASVFGSMCDWILCAGICVRLDPKPKKLWGGGIQRSTRVSGSKGDRRWIHVSFMRG